MASSRSTVAGAWATISGGPTVKETVEPGRGIASHPGIALHRPRMGHDRRTSRLSQGPAAHSALVELERFEGEAPEVTAFEPPPTA